MLLLIKLILQFVFCKGFYCLFLCDMRIVQMLWKYYIETVRVLYAKKYLTFKKSASIIHFISMVAN